MSKPWVLGSLLLCLTLVRAAEAAPQRAGTLVRTAGGPELRWHPYLQMDGAAGTALLSPMESGVASMATAARLRLGIFLSSRFSLEVEGGIFSTGEMADPQAGVAGHTFALFHVSLALRTHLLPYTRGARWVPFLLAGAQAHTARGLMETTEGREERRWRAKGAGGILGVGVDFPLKGRFTVELRAVYRPLWLGKRRWDQSTLTPLCPASVCGEQSALMHSVMLEMGFGVLF